MTSLKSQWVVSSTLEWSLVNPAAVVNRRKTPEETTPSQFQCRRQISVKMNPQAMEMTRYDDFTSCRIATIIIRRHPTLMSFIGPYNVGADWFRHHWLPTLGGRTILRSNLAWTIENQRRLVAKRCPRRPFPPVILFYVAVVIKI